MVVDNFFRGLANAGRAIPLARPERHGVEVIENVEYGEPRAPHHLLDIYRPARNGGSLPVVLYVHGGGFRILSKDTHWLMGLIFARRGFLLFNINYRLAPQHPFPAAIEDACRAYRWVVENAHRWGGDASRLILAGESAGGNLVTSLTVASCYERDESYARGVFDTGVTPRATIPACALLQVSETERFHTPKLPRFLRDRLDEVTHAYLGGVDESIPGGIELADPLLLFEAGRRPARPLPPFFAFAGTRDPLLPDTRRLKRALDAMQVDCDARYYPGGVHAFHAMIWQSEARNCWRDTFEFLRARGLP